MTQPPPAVPSSPAAPSAHSPSIWDRLLDDLHKRPSRYINGVIFLAIPVLVAVLAFKFWTGKKDEARGTLATSWQEVWAPDVDPKARAARLEELAPQIKDDEQQANRLFDLARTYRDIAEAATTQEEKLSAYEKLLATCQELKSKYPNSLWVKMPVRPQSTPGAPNQSFVGQLEDVAQRDLAWFKQHPFVGTVEPDAGLTATIELEDGRKIVVGKFFSRVAPFHVQNFVELARRGYFDGTAFSKVHPGFKKGATRNRGDRPPTIAAEAGHPMTKVTPEVRDDDDGQADIGYSVREEPNMLSPTRGSIAAIQDYTTGGDSPSRFKVFADEPDGAQDTVFAQVTDTDSLSVIDSIVNAPPPEGHPTWTKDLVRIKRIAVEGSVASPPERPFPPDVKMPEGPKAESKPDSRPESGPDSKGAESGPESKGAESAPGESRPK
jgi:cyclophilin family peptidyl-prolyl cis-trans isomerase